MKKITLLFLLLFVRYVLFAQGEQVQSYNVDQQRIDNGLPVNWFLAESKGYTFTMEKHSTYADKKQLRISSMPDGNGYSGVMMLNIPENLEGKEIIFEGKIKTENIAEDGFAGLFLQLKPKVDIENMEATKLNGTHDWQTFGVRLKLKPKETHSIAIATYLIGKGTAWFADLTLKIDGKDYTRALKYPSVNKADTLYNFNSQLNEFPLTPVNIEKLAHVAQIWGLLKYFHPAVTSGKWDMDTELFKFLPTLLASPDHHTSERMLAAWIGHFGSFHSKTAQPADTEAEIATEADDQWIDKLPYSDKLKDTLKSLCHVMPVVPNRYISYLKGVGNPVFDEYNYKTVPLSDVGFRLLGLFRYWNAIHYFNPNQKLMAQPWDKVLSDFIPVFVRATSKASLDAAYLQLFSKINDTHAFASLSDFYYRGVFGSRGVAFKTCFIQDQLVVTQLGDDQFKAGQELQIGDVIQEISGKPISSICDSLRQYVAASNESARKRDLPRWMLRTEDSLMLLKASREDKEFAIYVPTRKINIIKNFSEEAKPAIRKMKGGIVVVDIGTFRDSDTKRLKDSLQNQKGLILDYRNFPSASVHYELSDMVFPSQQEFVILSMNFGLRPGRFRYRSSDKVGAQNPNAFKGKIVMLVNETTQSASEFQVMAFRTIPGSLVVGSQTAGADGNVSSVPLPLGYSTFFSGLGVYYPDKTETQGVGIVPDRIVYPSIYGIREKQDELLQAGIDAILKP
ncbi:S41 family peptidase [Sphingobacterium paramultivorum]|uniref:S41 family peptidase n=1 Tax=Sphingobacterium paramultivorum TaxID=2886510 RepID=UPI00129C711C|nr:S41 family peptidase [Sphingobacterium paramultivorum]